MEELQRELKGVDQQEKLSNSLRVSRPTASILEDIKRISSLQEFNPQELEAVTEATELESQGDDTSNLATGPPSRPRLNPGLSFIKQASLYGLVNRMVALEDSIDDTSKESSNDISEQPSHEPPITQQPSSSRMWESANSDIDYDGTEELQRELEGVDPLQKSQRNDTSNLTKGPTSRPRLNQGLSFIKQESLFNLVSRMDALEDSMNDTSEEPSNDRRPPIRQLSSSQMWESETDFDCDDGDDGLDGLQSELEGADPFQAESIEDSIDEVNPEALQQETLSKPRQVSKHTLQNGKRTSNSAQKLNPTELQIVSEESEIESESNDTMNLTKGSTSRPRLNQGLSFIKQESLFNLVSRMDALEDSMNDTSEEPSNDRRPPIRQLSASQMCESETQKLQSVSGKSEIELESDDASDLVIVTPLRPSLNTAFSFMKKASLSNLMSRMGTAKDTINDTSKELSNDISKKASYRRPPSKQLLSSRMWESETDFDCNDGLQGLQKELEGADTLQIELCASGVERDDTRIRNSGVAGESTSQVKKSRTVPQHQLVEVLTEKNNALIDDLSVVTSERNQLKERQDGAMLKGKLMLDGKDVNSQKWVTDVPDKSYSKRKRILWLFYGIFLAILLLGVSPVVAPIFSLFKRRINSILVSDEALPSKITISGKREVFHDSELKNAKQALIQAKILLAETHEIASKFMEEQLV